MTASDRVKVYVIDMQRTYWYLQWKDPITGERKTESSGQKRKRDAYLVAAEREKKLNSAIPRGDGKLLFTEFVDLYDESHLRSLSNAARVKYLSVLNVFQRIVNPETIGHVSTATIVKFVATLRATGSPRDVKVAAKGIADSTIKSYLSALRAALSWAHSAGYLAAIPKMPKLARAQRAKAKGRPLTGPEFVKLLRAVKPVVGRKAARSWRRLLIGLWLSGLRLAEALELSWDDQTRLWIDTASGPYPLLGIAAEAEKGFQNRLMPITPDFARWILRTPIERRRGPVFPLVKARYKGVLHSDHVSKVITKIGRGSQIQVSSAGKFASAHDLRRSFGLRWSQKRYPAELQQMMRHENIQTTMKYYAVASATELAERLWAAEK